MKLGYVKIKHPITGQTISGVPTGKKKSTPFGVEAEIRIISPKSNIEMLWVKRGELLEE